MQATAAAAARAATSLASKSLQASAGIKNNAFVVFGGSGYLGSAVINMLLQNEASKVYNFDLIDASPESAGKCHPNSQMVAAYGDGDDAQNRQNESRVIFKREKENFLKSVIITVLQPCITRLVHTDDLTPKPTYQLKKAAEVSFFGRFNALKCAASALAASNAQNRSIIGLSSIFADEGQKGHSAYSALLGSLNSMTLPSARDLSQFGIRVNNICAGFFSSPNGLGSQSVQTREGIANLVPYPKRLGNSEDLAHCVKFMIENEYLNGVNLRLDGAMRTTP